MKLKLEREENVIVLIFKGEVRASAKLRTWSGVQSFILFPGDAFATYFLARGNEYNLLTHIYSIHDIYRGYKGINFE